MISPTPYKERGVNGRSVPSLEARIALGLIGYVMVCFAGSLPFVPSGAFWISVCGIPPCLVVAALYFREALRK